MPEFEHWMPADGGIRMCRMYRRRVASGDIIYTGRNGAAVWTLTPITNAGGSGPTHMLVLQESKHGVIKGDAA